MFSSRTGWHHETNRLTQRLVELRNAGRPIIDLTLSNPTVAGLEYPAQELIAALSLPHALSYEPDPRGLLSAREAVADYYARKNVVVHPSDIVLTASTSEAYSYLLMMLCDPGDDILVPSPSYPLFEYLAGLNHVQLRSYHLRYDGEWHTDVESVKNSVAPSTKAIVIVTPHNPTGMFLKEEELQAINDVAARRGIPLIVDEVFSDYGFGEDRRRGATTASNDGVLTFTLNGISKSCGLPQMKLGWIVVSGPESVKAEALRRLEIIADTFLSVNTPVQHAAAALFRLGADIRSRISKRIAANRLFLHNAILSPSPLTLLSSEGGWSAILRVPATKSDEEWALQLLDDAGVYVHPGFFFEFRENGYLVLSLLPTPENFSIGVKRLVEVFR